MSYRCSTGLFHGCLGGVGRCRRNAKSLGARVPPLFWHIFSSTNSGLLAGLFLELFKKVQKSFLPYAWPQAPGAEALLRARDQLGGMRFGRVHWPSRIFLRAMWRACRESNRLKAPVSMDQTTWRICAGAGAVEAADWRSRLKRPSSKEVSFRGRCVLAGVARPPLLPRAATAAPEPGAVRAEWAIKVRFWFCFLWSSGVCLLVVLLVFLGCC